MKYFIIILLSFFIQLQVNGSDTVLIAPTPRFEIGVLLEEPIGVSAKFWHGTIFNYAG